MSRLLLAASIAGLVCLSGCAKLNGAYQESDGGTSAGGSTDPDTGRVSDGTTAGSTSTTAAGSTSWPGSSSGDDTTGHGWTSTGVFVDMGSGPLCTLVPGQPCRSTLQDCPSDGETCAPFDPELNGSIEGTYCLPIGALGEGERCEPRCKGDEVGCGFGLVCDRFSDLDTRCRPTCVGEQRTCSAGICFEHEVSTGDRLAVCRGTCNPSDGAGCGVGDVCVLDEGGIPSCMLADSPGGGGDDCSVNLCDAGLLCAPPGVASCTDTACCVQACNPFGVEPCPEGGMCVAAALPGNVEVALGYCTDG